MRVREHQGIQYKVDRSGETHKTESVHLLHRLTKWLNFYRDVTIPNTHGIKRLDRYRKKAKNVLCFSAARPGFSTRAEHDYRPVVL
jgi:hypothetical protein